MKYLNIDIFDACAKKTEINVEKPVCDKTLNYNILLLCSYYIQSIFVDVVQPKDLHHLISISGGQQSK